MDERMVTINDALRASLDATVWADQPLTLEAVRAWLLRTTRKVEKMTGSVVEVGEVSMGEGEGVISFELWPGIGCSAGVARAMGYPVAEEIPDYWVRMEIDDVVQWGSGITVTVLGDPRDEQADAARRDS